jgi:hypothetical protein
MPEMANAANNGMPRVALGVGHFFAARGGNAVHPSAGRPDRPAGCQIRHERWQYRRATVGAITCTCTEEVAKTALARDAHGQVRILGVLSRGSRSCLGVDAPHDRLRYRLDEPRPDQGSRDHRERARQRHCARPTQRVSASREARRVRQRRRQWQYLVVLDVDDWRGDDVRSLSDILGAPTVETRDYRLGTLTFRT